jgi:hypothetical protein
MSRFENRWQEMNRMMLAAADHRVLVLRFPEEEGNFLFRVAELTDNDARRLEERLARGEAKTLPPSFGAPLTLVEVMDELESRDFRVLDYPSHP